MLDNPFFTREIRHLADQTRRTQIVLFLFLCLMSAELLGWMYLASQYSDRLYYRDIRGWCLSALLLTHITSCCIAGFYACFRVFMQEHLRHTFEPLQLIPMPPGKLLLQKLTFPAFTAAVTILAGIPFYYLAAGAKLIRIEAVGHFAHKFVLGGLVALLVTLLITPEYIQLQRQYQKSQAGGRATMSTRFTLWGLLQLIIGFVTGLGLVFGRGLSDQEISFFNTYLPEYAYWLVGVAVGTPAVWLTALDALHSTEKSTRRADVARAMAVTVFYLGIVASFWPLLPWWTRTLALAVIPLTLVYNSVIKEGKNEDSRSALETEWLVRQWDNPLLIHDFRVFSRHRSVRKLVFVTVFYTSLALSFLIGVTRNLQSDSTLVACIFVLGFGAFQMAMASWARSRLLWMKEWTEGTLPMLFLTPLTEREIILGRLLAVPAYFGRSMAVMLLPLGCILIWLWLSRGGVLAPLLLSMSPLLVTIGLWTSVQTTPVGMSSFRLVLGTGRQWLLRILQLAVLLQALFLITLHEEFPPAVSAAWFLALGIANLLLWRGWFQLRVDELRREREVGGGESPSHYRLLGSSRKQAA